MFDLESQLKDLPFLFAAGSRFPKTNAADKSVFVFSALDAFGQRLEAVHVAAAEDNIIGDERFLQLGDGEDHFAFPFVFAESIDSGNAEKIFDHLAIAIGEIAQLERQQSFLPNKGAAKSGPESQK